MNEQPEKNYGEKWVRVSQAAGRVPVSVSQLYKWSHLGKNKHLFSRLGGALFCDVEAAWQMVEAGRLEPEAKQ